MSIAVHSPPSETGPVSASAFAPLYLTQTLLDVCIDDA